MAGCGMKARLFAWMLQKGDPLNEKIYKNIKSDLFRGVDGKILEIGPGTGINLPFLPPGIEWTGLEPNIAFHNNLAERARSHHIQPKLMTGHVEDLALPDGSFDVVIGTLVLCSVKNLPGALAEIRRVLKKGGYFIFVEHVAAPKNTGLRKAQNLFNPVNRFLADGCNCNRETWLAIEGAGFDQVDIKHEVVKGPMKLHSPHIYGKAIK